MRAGLCYHLHNKDELTFEQKQSTSALESILDLFHKQTVHAGIDRYEYLSAGTLLLAFSATLKESLIHRPSPAEPRSLSLGNNFRPLASDFTVQESMCSQIVSQ